MEPFVKEWKMRLIRRNLDTGHAGLTPKGIQPKINKSLYGLQLCPSNIALYAQPFAIRPGVNLK